MMMRDTLRTAISQALAKAGLPEPEAGISVEPAKRRDQGDWSTPVAMQLAKPLRRPPLEIAHQVKDTLDAMTVPHLADVEVVAPGFVNLFLSPTWLHDVLRDVVRLDQHFGRSEVLAGRRINLEFVSANPTGPLHAGGGRWVAVGDAIANLLAAQGAQVHREYYLNDAGTQLDLFATSLYARYRGEPPPEDLPGSVPR